MPHLLRIVLESPNIGSMSFAVSPNTYKCFTSSVQYAVYILKSGGEKFGIINNYSFFKLIKNTSKIVGKKC